MRKQDENMWHEKTRKVYNGEIVGQNIVEGSFLGWKEELAKRDFDIHNSWCSPCCSISNSEATQATALIGSRWTFRWRCLHCRVWPRNICSCNGESIDLHNWRHIVYNKINKNYDYEMDQNPKLRRTHNCNTVMQNAWPKSEPISFTKKEITKEKIWEIQFRGGIKTDS